MYYTIKDVALKAGVAQSTVSLVINERANVAPDTRRKILEAIKKLNFHPRHSARNLALAKGGSIGFVLTEQFFRVSEPFYTRILLGAEFEAAQQGFYTLLSRVKEPFDFPKDIPRFLLDRSIDGIIVAGRAPKRLLKFINERKIPSVLVDFKLPSVKTNHVLIDNLAGSIEAVKHLISVGHSRIGFVAGSSTHPSIQERYEGYRQVMFEHHGDQLKDIDKLSYLDEEEASPAIGREGALKLLNMENPPTALFACNDATAAGCYKAIREMGLRIPQDIAIMGFDDVNHSTHLDPDLSTVHIYKAEMGKEAVRSLVDQLENPDQPFKTKIVSTKLMVRGSCGGERTPEIDYF
ncbi:MAG: LacI family DNA-binding transcriptional regulator [Candidatus Marinimicrobia bacterium]|nr:LacI family DNA-binding transcriptional regulator [Candidatus Neomarinimicrobiota bacterium]